MKLKNGLLVLIFLITPIFLFGCDLGSIIDMNARNISDLEKVFEKYNNTTDMDLDYTFIIDTGVSSVTVNGKMIKKKQGDQSILYVKTGDGEQANEMYYIGGFLYSECNEEYTISEVTDADVSKANPIPSYLDFNTLKYKFKSTELDYDFIYTVTMTDNTLKSYVEQVLGKTIEDNEIKMILQVKYNHIKDAIESMNYDITLTKDESIIHLKMSVSMNSISDNVALEVPNNILDRIEKYKLIIQSLDPVPTKYEDTLDGVVHYYTFGVFKNILFDDKNNQIIIQREKTIEIRNAYTMEIVRAITSSLPYTNIDVDNGKLVVGCNTRQFKIYDLSQESEPIIFQTDINVVEIVMDNNMVIYTNDDQWCTVTFQNINTNEKKKITIFQPLFTLNRKDHILYMTETNISSSHLIYYNSQTGNLIPNGSSPEFSYVNDRIMFDGKYLHFEGQSFNRFNGKIVSSNYLDHFYTPLAGFNPKVTLLDSEKTSFIGGDFQIGIYDNLKETYVYQLPIIYDKIIELNDGKYCAFSTERKYVAIVDVSLIDEDLMNDEVLDQVGSISVSEDGYLKTLQASNYTDSIVDGHYIYALNENNYELNVYDVETLEIIHTEHFDLKPVSMDVNSGMLVIGFGDALQIRIYDTTTWGYEIVNTAEPVYSIIIYNNTIIYTGIKDHCQIKVYSMIKKTFTNFGFYGYSISMAINREDGIIYFGEYSKKLAYYDVVTKQQILLAETGNTDIHLDGYFVHYGNKTFDKITGVKISDSNLARIYQNNSISDGKTVFDNNVISIYTGMKDDHYVTVIYDLASNTELYTLETITTQAYVVGDTIVLLNNSSEFIRTLTLSE